MPTFDPASGNASPWEVGLRYEVWKKQVLTTASAISPSFAEYVKKCFEEGLRRHHEQIQGGRATPLQPIQGFPAEFEARFVMSLLTILPDNIKTPALEGDNASDNIRSVRLIEEILLRVQPGGLEEQSTLMRFVRGLQPAASAKEALDLIRRWKLAKQRIASLGLPEPACFEQLKGIGVLLGRLEKKHEQLRMRLALLRLNPDVQMGKPGAVETILDNCDQQLRQIAADETSKEGGNSDSIIVATKGTSKGLSKEDKKKITCPFLAKPGGCSFGDRCHYSHANQPRPKPKAEPKRGVPPAKSEPTLKKKCIFHARKSGCKKGDACEYLHEGPSGAAQATAGGPGLVGGTASQVDAGTSSASDSNRAKAKAKAKAAAKTAPKVYAAHSTVSSFACMFASRPLRSQGVAVVPQGELWMCEMGPDELIHWMDNPFGVTGFFTSTTDSLLGSAWLAAFDANRFDALADIDTDLGGGNSIIDVSLATAWNQRTSEHDTCFVFIIHTSVGEYLHVALMVAEHRPGCDRPMTELQKRRWDESFVTRHVVEEGSGEQEEIQSVHPSLGDASELSSLSEGTEDTEGSTVSYDSRGFEFGDPFEGFWYFVLSRDEYLEWKRPGTLITRARNAFKPVVGSTSVATGIWRALESVDFSLPLQQLAMGQEQVILEAQTVYVLHADRVFRECVLVCILDMDSGQEQFLILARGVVAPRVERDIRQVAGPPQAAPTWRPPSGGDVSSSSQGFPQVDACISAVNQQGADGILLDSGANEILRQVRVTPKNSTPLPLQLADGQNITAHRTLGGEVVIQGEPGEFVCGVNRLIQIGCKFEWAKTGAYLTLPDGTVETLDVRNGLPFMTRRVFQTLRPMMQSWWKKSCCAGVTSQIAKAKNTWMAFDDLVAASVEAPSSRKTNVKHGEQLATDFLARGGTPTYDSIWQLIRASTLEPVRCKRSVIEGAVAQKSKVKSWTFGAYTFSQSQGLTVCTRERPQLVKVLVGFLKSILPKEASWTSITLSDGMTFQPHRDKSNLKGSQNFIVCLNDSTSGTGGNIWVADQSGDEVREVRPGVFERGYSHCIRRCPLAFDPHEWHGTEPWIGERCTIVAYTSGAWEQCSGDEKAELTRLGFPLPRNASETVIDKTMVATAEQTTADIDAVPVHTTFNSEGIQEGVCEQDFTERVQGVQGRRDVHSCAHGASALESDLEYEPSLLADAPALESEPELILNPDQELRVVDEDSPYEYAHKQKPDHTVADFGSRGTLRPHRRLSRDDVAQGCLSIDITGPFKKGFSEYRYALIGNFNAPESDPLYFCRPLRRRLKAEVIGVVFDMIAEIHSMAGARPEVVRLHSDCAAEFVAKDMKAAAEQKGIYRTMSVPYEHASKGRAERAIRYLKEKATKFILESGAPSELWLFALWEAAIVQREEVLNLKKMKNQPKPWMLVAINIHNPEPFAAKTETARFLCRDEHTSNGALCMVSRNGRQVITTARLPAVIPVDRRVWRTHTTPLGDLVWVSDRGEVRDADALRDIGQDLGLITYEESRLGPSPNAGNFPVHIAAKTVSIPHRCTCKRCTLSRHSEPADATAYQVGDADEETTADEKAALLQEVMATKAGAETLTTSVLFQGTPERREKWFKAAVKEMDGMKAKGVLEDLDRDHLREQLGLSPEEPIPEILPCKLVAAAKPEDVAPITVSDDTTNPDPAEQPWKAKIRLCACGNFEGVREHEDNTTSNVSPIALRLMAHELARHKSWVGANGDVSMAFLNTELEPAEIVLLEPPSALKKLGLVAPRTIWRARRYIYGLRRSPKKWARLRDDTMHGKSLKYDGNRELVISLVDEQEGLFNIRDSESQEVVALCAMYVDDIWCIGLPSAVTAILDFVSGTWETKLGGFISRDPSITISVNGEALSRLDEITFIGQQFRFLDNEVVINQRCWLLNEIAKRNWLHLKGTPSLPILEQGPDEDREASEYKRHLQEAQTEVGCLMWLSTKTRPDVLASVSQVASVMHRRPLRVIQITRGIWRYLRSTLNLSLHFNGHDEGHLDAYSDASHAPEGGRSRSGGVVMFGSSPITWWTAKQTVTAWSTCESEMDAMALTISVG